MQSKSSVMTVVKSISIGLLLVSSLPTFALSGRYVGFSTGIAMHPRTPGSIGNSSTVPYTPTLAPSGSSIFQLQNVFWKNNFSNGLPISLTLGSQLSPHWRLEGEFYSEYMQRKTSGSFGWTETDAGSGTLYLSDPSAHPIPSTTTNADVFALLVNGYYDVVDHGRFAPFIGFGVGPALVTSRSATGSGSLTINSISPAYNATFPLQSRSQTISSMGLAYQFKAGLQYMLNNNVHLFAMYRHFATGTLTVKSGKLTTTPGASGPAVFVSPSRTISGVLSNNIEIGVSYYFN